MDFIRGGGGSGSRSLVIIGREGKKFEQQIGMVGDRLDERGYDDSVAARKQSFTFFIISRTSCRVTRTRSNLLSRLVVLSRGSSRDVLHTLRSLEPLSGREVANNWSSPGRNRYSPRGVITIGRQKETRREQKKEEGKGETNERKGKTGSWS